MPKITDEIQVKVSISELVGDVESLKDIKAKKNGEITVNELLKVLLNESNKNLIEDIAVVRKYTTGNVVTGWTCTDGITGLGMAEFLRLHISDGVE